MKNSDGRYEELALAHAEVVKGAIVDRVFGEGMDEITAGLHAQLAIAYANLAVAAELDWANSHPRGE